MAAYTANLGKSRCCKQPDRERLNNHISCALKCLFSPHFKLLLLTSQLCQTLTFVNSSLHLCPAVTDAVNGPSVSSGISDSSDCRELVSHLEPSENEDLR